MSKYIERELKKIQIRLHELEPDTVEHDKFYIAQQALSWAIDPTAVKSPYDMLMGIDTASEKQELLMKESRERFGLLPKSK